MSSQKIIYTIGHSTHTIKDFVALLHTSNIEFLIDVRSFPGSRKYPHFHKESLAPVLEHEGIQYIHMRELGGRRKALPDSHNTAWRNISFRGYADYMETQEFRDGIERLEKIASHGTTAYMCSEAVWWRCHRSMISDFLLSRGWTVLHIMALGKVIEHSYTAPAYLIDGRLSYHAEE